ncbi:hypothetical protein BGZ98_000425, partial [Dissophora globulifera]
VAAWPRIVEKYCPPNKTGREAWDNIYGRIESDEDALKASIRVLDHSIFTYPDFQPCELCRNARIWEAKGVAAVDANGQGLGAHHGVDLVYVFAPDLALEKVFTEEEKLFSEQIQTTWILFAYGETSSKGQ